MDSLSLLQDEQKKRFARMKIKQSEKSSEKVRCSSIKVALCFCDYHSQQVEYYLDMTTGSVFPLE